MLEDSQKINAIAWEAYGLSCGDVFVCGVRVLCRGWRSTVGEKEKKDMKRNIPYHVTAREGVVFDRELAEQFEAPNRLLIEAGEEIVIE